MSTKSKTSQAQTTTQQDNRIIADGGAIAVSGSSGVTVNTSDMGLIDSAFSYFEKKDILNAATTDKLVDAAGAGLETIFSAGASVIQQSTASAGALLAEAGKAANPSGQQSRMEMMLLGVAALFIVMQYRGAK